MISVVIVNYNKKDLLKRCIESVLGQSFKDIEIIVVDNASKDGSLEMIEDYPGIKLIRNTENLLFSKAYNQGIAGSRGEFVLCLNNDCFLDKDYLKEISSLMNLDPRIGMASGKILRMDKETIDSTGLFLGRNRKAVERGYGQKDKGQYEKPGYVFGASGSCAFFRKEMLEDVKDKNGYFDETFGMYYEDLDISWRAQKKGWKAYYSPKAIAYHMRGATAVQLRESPAATHGVGGHEFRHISEELRKKYIKNRYKCMLKNDSLFRVLINLPFILWYEIKIWGYVIFDSRFFLTKLARHIIIKLHCY